MLEAISNDTDTLDFIPTGMKKWLWIFLFVLLSGCTTINGSQSLRMLEPSSETPSEYILGAGDLIEVAFFRNPSAVRKEYRIQVNDKIHIEFPNYSELNIDVVVPPDGKIMPKNVEEMSVIGLTPSELSQKLKQVYTPILTYPELVVSLTQFYSPVQEFFNLLNQKDQIQETTIRSDGKISLPFIREMQAEGLTPSALAQEIQSKYSQILPELEVSIHVKNEGSKKVLVLGEVKNSGIYQLSRSLTPLEAIILAGGPSDNALLDRVVIIRKARNDSSEIFLFNVKESLSKSFRSPSLQPYDIVFVPKKTMAEIGAALRQIYNLLPPYMGFGFSYSLSKGGGG